MPRLFFKDGPFRGRVVTLAGDRWSIGRSPTNEIAFPASPAISSFHAVLLRRPADGSWWIEDLRSRNGTFVNGTRIMRAPLREGDVITFAGDDTSMEFTRRDTPADADDFMEATVAIDSGQAAVRVMRRRARVPAAVKWIGGALSLGALAVVVTAAVVGRRCPSTAEDRALCPGEGAIAIACHIDPIYGSQFLSYRDSPLGSVTIANRGTAPLRGLRLRFGFTKEAESFTVVPFQADVPDLPPGAEAQVPILPRLSRDVLAPETREVTARFEILAGENVVAAHDAAVFVHGRNVFNWETPARIAAFVYPQTPDLEVFVRSVWRARSDAATVEFPPQPVRDALCLFTGLAELNLRYIPDATTPISKSIDHRANDRVSYPCETLAGGAGDCDDLSVLCAAMLEAAGIPTAILVTPRHVLVMFDTGIAPGALDATPLERATVIVWRDRVWMPLETTVLGWPGAGFAAAWANAWRYRQGVESGETHVVFLREAWEKYPPMHPPAVPQVEAQLAGMTFVRDDLPAKIETASAKLRQLFAQNLQERIAAVERDTPPGMSREHAIGLLYAQSGLYSLAREAFERALFSERVPPADALGAALAALPADADTAHLLVDLGICITLGAHVPADFRLAIAYYEAAITRLPPPDREECMLRCALAYRLHGDLASEKRWTTEALAAAPTLRTLYDELVSGTGARAGGDDAIRAWLRQGLR